MQTKNIMISISFYLSYLKIYEGTYAGSFRVEMAFYSSLYSQYLLSCSVHRSAFHKHLVNELLYGASYNMNFK